MKRHMWFVPLLSIALLSGCANLKSVRDFAAETKKVGVAYEPIGKATEATCIQTASLKDENELVLPAKDYDPGKVRAKAVATCKPVTDALKGPQKIADVLKAYADTLSELAGDGLASRLDDDYDSLIAQIKKVPEVPADKVSAIGSLVKFLSGIAIAKMQIASIEEVLAHEAAVGSLGDALVFVAERNYQEGYAKDLLAQMDAIMAGARTSNLPPLLARMQITQIAAERSKLAEQRAAVAQLKKAVNQMKVAMADVRANFRKIDDKTRLESIIKYKQEVTALYEELAKAF